MPSAMRASAARSISVTMSVAVDFVVTLDRARVRPSIEEGARVVRQLRREREERREVGASTAGLFSHGATVGGGRLRA